MPDTLSFSPELVAGQLETPDAKVALAFILDMRVRCLALIMQHVGDLVLASADDTAGVVSALSRMQGEFLVMYSSAHASHLKLVGYFAGRHVAWLNASQATLERGASLDIVRLARDLEDSLQVLDDMLVCLSDTGSEHFFWSEATRRDRYTAVIRHVGG